MERIDSTQYYDHNAKKIHARRSIDSGILAELTPFLNELKPASKVLDFGCGSGMDLYYIEKAGHEVSGIETSEAMVAIAKLSVPKATIIQKNGLFYTPYPNEFNAIWMNETLNLFPSEQGQRLIASCFKGLKPGGIFGAIIYSGEGVFEDRAEDLQGPSRTVYLYNEKPACSMIEQTGFEILKIGKQQDKLLILAKRV